LTQLQKVPGINATRAATLYDTHHIGTVAELARVPHLLTPAQLLEATYFVDFQRAAPAEQVAAVDDALAAVLRDGCGGAFNGAVCGAYRRGEATCRDVDAVLVATAAGASLVDGLALVLDAGVAAGLFTQYVVLEGGTSAVVAVPLPVGRTVPPVSAADMAAIVRTATRPLPAAAAAAAPAAVVPRAAAASEPAAAVAAEPAEDPFGDLEIPDVDAVDAFEAAALQTASAQFATADNMRDMRAAAAQRSAAAAAAAAPAAGDGGGGGGGGGGSSSGAGAAAAAEAALDLSVPAQFLRLRLLAVRDCDAGAALITATGPPAYLEMLRKHAASVDMAFDGVSVRPLHKTTLSAAVVGGAKKGAAGFFKKPAAAAAAPAGEARVITEAGAPLALGTEEAVFAALHLPAVEPTARAAAAAAAAATAAAAAAAAAPSAAAAAAGE